MTATDPFTLPGSASLIEDLDKKLLITLRDGRNLIGILRCVDQFGNLVMHNTIERIHIGKKYGDIPLGVFIIRGENVVLIGDLDPEKEDSSDFEYVEAQEIIALQRIDRENKQKIEEARSKALKDRGLSPRENLIDEM